MNLAKASRNDCNTTGDERAPKRWAILEGRNIIRAVPDENLVSVLLCLLAGRCIHGALPDSDRGVGVALQWPVERRGFRDSGGGGRRRQCRCHRLDQWLRRPRGLLLSLIHI